VIVVVDTSPLIALDRIERLDVLRLLFGRVVRPQSVVDELLSGKSVHGGSGALFDAPWMETVPDPAEAVFRKELGAGETAALALAKTMGADLILLDDLAARRVAFGLGLRVSGTLGVLAAAAQRGIVPDFAEAMESLRRAGIWVSDSVVAAALELGKRP
jgi:predicted nucleic acid-binding protein